MKDGVPSICSPYDSDQGNPKAELFFKEYDRYIHYLVRTKIPRHLLSPELLDLEIEEFVQDVHTALWRTSRRSEITNPRAYINRIVERKTIDMVRRHKGKSTVPLPLNDDGELDQGKIVGMVGEVVPSPADEVEQKEALTEILTQIVDMALSFPPCEQRAVLCTLQDLAADFPQIVTILRDRGIALEGNYTPSHRWKVKLFGEQKN